MSIDRISSMSLMVDPPRMKPPSAVEMSSDIISAKDMDGDGVLSIEETGLSEENFAVLDTDGDSAISKDELVSKITEKLEAMKETIDSGALRPNGPPPPGGPRSPGPPPQEDTDETEELTELEQLLEMMNETGDSMTDSSRSGLNMYTMILEELGLSKQEQSDFIELVQKNGKDLLA